MPTTQVCCSLPE